MRIIKVEYVSGYKLKLTFSDKTIKIVDLEEKVKHGKRIFLPLKDLDYFKQVAVDDCQLSICWPNGADICPDTLYQMRSSTKTPISRKKRSPQKRKNQTRHKKKRIKI
ncbi:MAG: DUF2442 domain-containing protein [Verrucomicrobiota bacterium]|nr:DUF2442 domain-containing protein [Verrucomicrobiota bacterium]